MRLLGAVNNVMAALCAWVRSGQHRAVLQAAGCAALFAVLLAVPQLRLGVMLFCSILRGQDPVRFVEFGLLSVAIVVFCYCNRATLQPHLADFIRVLATLMVFMLHSVHSMIFAGEYNMFEHPKSFPLWLNGESGVWILFVLSGYLAALGFASGRHEARGYAGVAEYYVRRIKAVWLPVVLFNLALTAVADPASLGRYPLFIVDMITMRFHCPTGLRAVGVTWYVFTLMPLYALAPFAWRIMYGKPQKQIALAAMVVALLGLAYRIIVFRVNADYWWVYVYTPFYGNADLFLIGMLAASYNASCGQNSKATDSSVEMPLGGGGATLRVALVDGASNIRAV